MASLFDHVKAFFLTHGFHRTYYLAYSGGLDSSVLLHCAARLQPLYPLKLIAVHIHHGLSPNADQWAAHCQATCAAWGVAYQSHAISVNPVRGESLEAAARAKRYQIFQELLQADDYLLTAHQQDDQAETVLLQLMRGAGIKGLAAMPELKSLGRGAHARPLLAVSRAALRQYAEELGLTWIEDESNAACHFDRNFMRLKVLPLLAERWPAAQQMLARTAAHCAAAEQSLAGYTAADLAAVQGSDSRTLSVARLQAFDRSRQGHLVRAWLQQLGFPVPSTVKLTEILEQLCNARHDKTPIVHWGEVELRRYQGLIYALKKQPIFNPAESFTWDLSQPLQLPNNGRLCATSVAYGLRSDLTSLTVRFRQGGETCVLPGRAHHHTLKNLFHAWRIPPWERARLPLLFAGDTLVMVPGYYLDERYRGEGGAWEVVWDNAFHPL